jgi:hypothetical protein
MTMSRLSFLGAMALSAGACSSGAPATRHLLEEGVPLSAPVANGTSQTWTGELDLLSGALTLPVNTALVVRFPDKLGAFLGAGSDDTLVGRLTYDSQFANHLGSSSGGPIQMSAHGDVSPFSISGPDSALAHVSITIAVSAPPNLPAPSAPLQVGIAETGCANHLMNDWEAKWNGPMRGSATSCAPLERQK